MTLYPSLHIYPVFVFSSGRVQTWELDHKEGWAFELWCWRRLLRIPWTARRSNQSILKEINPEYSPEGPMLNWSSNTLATWCKEPTQWKRPWCWERLRAEGKGGDRGWDGWMASLIQWTQVWANSGRQWRTGTLVCFSPWGCKELDISKQLNKQ